MGSSKKRKKPIYCNFTQNSVVKCIASRYLLPQCQPLLSSWHLIGLKCLPLPSLTANNSTPTSLSRGCHSPSAALPLGPRQRPCCQNHFLWLLQPFQHHPAPLSFFYGPHWQFVLCVRLSFLYCLCVIRTGLHLAFFSILPLWVYSRGAVVQRTHGLVCITVLGTQ